MNCVHCGGDGFNRVVVRATDGAELGSLCEACEDETFGVTLEDRELRRTAGCQFCPADGPFALPVLECVVEWDDAARTDLEYALDEETPRLCRDHLASFVLVDPTAARRRPGSTPGRAGVGSDPAGRRR